IGNETSYWVASASSTVRDESRASPPKVFLIIGVHQLRTTPRHRRGPHVKCEFLPHAYPALQLLHMAIHVVDSYVQVKHVHFGSSPRHHQDVRERSRQ